MCPYGKLSYTTMAFEQYSENYVLILLSLAICLSIAGFNGFGVAVTKNASAAQRSTIDTCRTLVVWVFFMCVSSNAPYKEYFHTLQLFGFIVLVFGTLVYNEILIIPFWGFNTNTKQAIKKRQVTVDGEKIESMDEKDANYISLSPHAGYDATRNQRIIQHKMEEEHETSVDNINKTREYDK